MMIKTHVNVNTLLCAVLCSLNAIRCASRGISTKCQTDLDCQLTGSCSDGVCDCHPGWHGEQCGQLMLAPITSSDHIGYVASGQADRAQNISCSWGGNLIKEKTGEWSLITAAMLGNCGIGEWSTNSEVIRATASAPEGPFRFSETIVRRFAHEPNVVTAEDGSLVMFYTGTINTDPLVSCSKPTNWPWATTASTPKVGHVERHLNTRKRGPIPPGYMQTWMTYAESGSARGPWSEPVKLNPGAACVKTLDTNFNAAILPNGSLVGLWRCVQTLNTTQPGATVIHTVHAQHWRNSATYMFSPTPAYPQREFGTEDPFVWIAADGSFHAILHDEDECCPSSRDSALGKHAYSADGYAWHLSESYAYNHTVHFDDGHTSLNLVRRERPHLLLDENRVPLYLTNGVQLYNDADHTFTLVQPIARTK
eukprot:m.62541 g.62541  ORF g.62541 m.62541 type:complete len:423 (+) comp23170_c0_seq2:145-1413(+)